MNRITAFFVISLLSGCAHNSSDNGDNVRSNEKAESIFPIVLEYQECSHFGKTDNIQYFKYIITFDSGGYSRTGQAMYDDKSCSIFVHRDINSHSRYPSKLGFKVVNEDGSIGNELYFPDPEQAGLYGTVYQIDGDTLCFSKGTFTLEMSENQPGFIGYSAFFAHTSSDGDFSGLEIDKDNCFNILSRG